MIPFSEAFRLLIASAPVAEREMIGIEMAAGRVLRQDVRADRAFPPFDRVMMDGFALRAADLRMNRSFRLTGSAPAGQPAATLSAAPWSCLEVMTGAPLPIGADCIVPVEMTSSSGEGAIRISESFEFAPGRFIHPAGSDAAAGEILLESGTLLGSREIGVAASCGAASLQVSRMPRIAVIATGDELVGVDEIPAAHQIRQSNAHAIRSALQRAGYPPCQIGILRDEPGEAAMLRQSLRQCEWLILTGAVSKGARDFIPALLDSLGCTRLFHGVSQRPGKPAGCWIGPDQQLVMALPGNPVSALTGLHAFVLPALAAASGRPLREPRRLVSSESIEGLPGMTHHLPVALDDAGGFSPAPTGNSGDFIGLLRSDGFVTLPPKGASTAAFPFTPWI